MDEAAVTLGPIDYRSLIDQRAIDAAGQRHVDLGVRLTDARAQATAATAAIETTEAAFAAATVAGDGAAAEAAATAHDGASAKAKLLGRAVAALEAAFTASAAKDLPAAKVSAWRPVLQWAKAERMTASQTRDAALTALGDATARFHRANSALQAGQVVPPGYTGIAYAGCQLAPQALAGLPLSVADETLVWQEIGL